MWLYDVLVEGVELDIEYTTSVSEAGLPVLSIESVQIAGVDVGPLLNSLNDKVDDVLEAAVLQVLQDEKKWNDVFAGVDE